MQVLNEQEVAQNVQKIAQDVREAALQAGRDPSEVQVMAVTKTVDPVLVNAGHRRGHHSAWREQGPGAVRQI